MRWTATYLGVALAFGLCVVLMTSSAWGQLRKVGEGDGLPSFTLPTLDGQEYTHEHRQGRVSVVVFLAAYQKRSERAAGDLLEIVTELRQDAQPVDLVVVISGGEGLEYFRQQRQQHGITAPMLIDADDTLWGRLGIVVTPTTIISGRQGIVRWIRAGHGYDFANDARSRLKRALGTATDPGDDLVAVRALENNSLEDRAKRHVRMGQILARQGRVEAGLVRLRSRLPRLAALQGRVRTGNSPRTSLIRFAFSTIWKSNMPTQVKSAPLLKA